MFASKQQLLTAAIVSSIILSVAAFAGSAAAVGTTVKGPDEVTNPDRFTITSTVDFEDGEQVAVENYTLTLRPAGADEETANLTFAPDGEVLGTDPERGVVGQGEIRVTKLRKSTEVTPVDGNGSYGYTAGYGDNQTTVTYDVELDSTAFKNGDYEVFLTVNTENETGLYPSNVESLSVQSPGDGERGQSERGDGDRGDGESEEDESDEDESDESDRGSNGNGRGR